MMEWLTWKLAAFGLGGVSLVALIAVFVLAPAAALRVAGELLGWALDKFRQGVEWLRVPGNGRRALKAGGFIALCLWGAAASLTAWEKNSQIVVVTRQLEDANTARGEAETALSAERTTRAQRELAFEAIQREQAASLARAQAASAAAAKEAAAAKARAEAGYDNWLKKYLGRPETCRAAEEALDRACASLGTL